MRGKDGSESCDGVEEEQPSSQSTAKRQRVHDDKDESHLSPGLSQPASLKSARQESALKKVKDEFQCKEEDHSMDEANSGAEEQQVQKFEAHEELNNLLTIAKEE